MMREMRGRHWFRALKRRERRAPRGWRTGRASPRLVVIWCRDSDGFALASDSKITAVNTSGQVTRLAAALGFLAVALGAFGAHGLKPLLEHHGTAATWETAVLYHALHAVALLALAARPRPPAFTAWCFLAGIVVFSGSLYVLALTGVRWLGAITPLGGVALLAGWAALVWRPGSAAGETSR